MSRLESFFWHFLGYAAIPVIIVAGIVISALVFYLLMDFLQKDGDENQ